MLARGGAFASETRGSVEGPQVPRVELADLAGAHLPKPNGTDPHADEAAHGQADAVEHPTNLALATLDHHHAHGSATT